MRIAKLLGDPELIKSTIKFMEGYVYFVMNRLFDFIGSIDRSPF